MTGHLYDDDIVTWSQQQVVALKKLARQPMLTNAADWDNIVDEIESLGRSEWKGVVSQIGQVLFHILKVYGDPDAPCMLGWFREVNGFLKDIRRDYTSSMRSKIDLNALWVEAAEEASLELLNDRRSMPPGLPRDCPFAIEDVLHPAFDLDAAIARLLHLDPSKTSSLIGNLKP